MIREMTQQKIAVVVDQSISADDLEELIASSDAFIKKNPDMSLRIFYLKWSEHIPVNS